MFALQGRGLGVLAALLLAAGFALCGGRIGEPPTEEPATTIAASASTAQAMGTAAKAVAQPGGPVVLASLPRSQQGQ